MKPQGETKGQSWEERAGEARDEWRGQGQGHSQGRRGEQDELEQKTRREIRNPTALYKPCFLSKTGQLEDLEMQSAVPQVLGTRDAGSITHLRLISCPLPPTQQGIALHGNQCPAAISLHYARLAKGEAALAK